MKVKLTCHGHYFGTAEARFMGTFDMFYATHAKQMEALCKQAYETHFTKRVLPELLEWSDQPEDERRRWHILNRYFHES